MAKNKWMTFDELPEDVKPLAYAFDQLFPLHHGHVVRLASQGRFFVQVFGRISVRQLEELDDWFTEDDGVYVEIEALAPKHVLIMLWKTNPDANNLYVPGNHGVLNFMYREMA